MKKILFISVLMTLGCISRRDKESDTSESVNTESSVDTADTNDTETTDTDPEDTDSEDTDTTDPDTEDTDTEEPYVPNVEDALSFSLQVIETYFDPSEDGFNTWLGYLHEPLHSLDGDVFSLSNAVYEESHPNGYDYSAYTITDYLNSYNPAVFTYEQMLAMYPEVEGVSAGDWTYDEDDFAFMGSQVKQGMQGFIWDDILVFIVNHSSMGEWKVIAIGG